jgi:hypothetical protein
MEKNKIRKVKMHGKGLSGIEVHYVNDVRRSGLDVIRTNQSKDPIPVPIGIRDEMQKLKFYFMLLMMQMTQEDEVFLNELATGFSDDEISESDMERYREFKVKSQRIYVIQYELDDSNSCSITADIEMLEEKIKGITTVKVSVDDDFPRYYDMVRVIRDISKKVEEYVFDPESHASMGVKDIAAMLKELMPKKADEIEDMDDQSKMELYRSYLEDHGHIVISSDDMSDRDPDAGIPEEVPTENAFIPSDQMEQQFLDNSGDDGSFMIPEDGGNNDNNEDVKQFTI